MCENCEFFYLSNLCTLLQNKYLVNLKPTVVDEMSNTWINKSRDWHIDGVANKSSVWFFMSTNLQKIRVKISCQSDVWSTSCNDLNDASLDILKTVDLKQFRMLIYHCFLMKKNTVQAQQWLEKCYENSAPSKTTICRWYADFERGCTDTEGAERSGRPNEIFTPETIEKVHQIVFENRKLKLREIADTLKISYGSVYAILHEHLSIRKLLWKWVPRLLTVDQKRQRVVDSERCLELFRRNKPNSLRRYVTMDETWIHHYTPE